MSDLCQKKDCPNHLKYWRYCGHRLLSVKPAYVIPKVSEKRKELNRKEYTPASKEITKDKVCIVNSPVCIKTPVHPHHLKGRTPKLLSEKKFMIPCCDPCNGYIESHTSWAKSNGFKLSKYN